jgi:hypothetical protein
LLDASYVQSFTQSGVLSFSLQPFIGDIVFNKASLTVDVDESVAAVPEPATILLLGSGLFALAGRMLAGAKKCVIVDSLSTSGARGGSDS